MKVAYFTAGTVGAGDLLQGLAIERALERAGAAVEFRAFSPEPPFPYARYANYTPVPVPMRELQQPAAAPESELARALLEYRPDILIVGLFWAPLRYVLPLPGCEHWLLIRRCPDIWFVGPPEAPFEPGQYERIVAVEPLEYDLFTDRIDPGVLCNPDECRPREALRELLNVEESRRLVVVSHAGDPGEIDEMPVDAGTDDLVVYFSLYDDQAPFPLCAWLGGADAVVCGAGYNSFWEARTLGYFDRTTFVPFPRRIDDQAWRVRECSGIIPRENGADTLARWISSGGG